MLANIDRLLFRRKAVDYHFQSSRHMIVSAIQCEVPTQQPQHTELKQDSFAASSWRRYDHVDIRQKSFREALTLDSVEVPAGRPTDGVQNGHNWSGNPIAVKSSSSLHAIMDTRAQDIETVIEGRQAASCWICVEAW